MAEFSIYDIIIAYYDTIVREKIIKLLKLFFHDFVKMSNGDYCACNASKSDSYILTHCGKQMLITSDDLAFFWRNKSIKD